MTKKSLIPDQFEKEELVFFLEDTVENLDKKRAELRSARLKMGIMRNKFMKMNSIIKNQRERIIQLFKPGSKY